MKPLEGVGDFFLDIQSNLSVLFDLSSAKGNICQLSLTKYFCFLSFFFVFISEFLFKKMFFYLLNSIERFSCKENL